jgi:hypothetical protein
MRQNEGPGKSTYTFSAERLPLSAPHQASVGRASRWGWGGGAESRRRSLENVYVDLPGPTKWEVTGAWLINFMKPVIEIFILFHRHSLEHMIMEQHTLKM